MEVHHLKEYEADFVQFLLNGIADEALDISPKCIQFLEEHGVRMKDALIQLGDLEDEDKEGEAKNETEESNTQKTIPMETDKKSEMTDKVMKEENSLLVDLQD